jgi:hypothetical protein
MEPNIHVPIDLTTGYYSYGISKDECAMRHKQERKCLSLGKLRHG